MNLALLSLRTRDALYTGLNSWKAPAFTSPETDFAMTSESLKGVHDELTCGGVTSCMRRRYSLDLPGVDMAVLRVSRDDNRLC